MHFTSKLTVLKEVKFQNDTTTIRDYISGLNTASVPAKGEEMNLLASQIWLLQNMENETNLIHRKIVNQEPGEQGVRMWSPSQKKCFTYFKISKFPGYWYTPQENS